MSVDIQVETTVVEVTTEDTTVLVQYGSGPPGVDGADGDPGPAPNGTGIVSVTGGVLDTPATLRARVAADATNLRTDLELGDSATRNVGTTAGTVAVGDHTHAGVYQPVGNYATGGGTATGNNTGDQTDISGNAGTATKLATPRAINGVNFDGTAAITITAAPTSHASNHATGGSDPIAPASIGAAATSGTLGQFASTTSAQLASVLSDETGTGGGFVRADGPTLSGVTLTGTTTAATITASGTITGTSSYFAVQGGTPRVWAGALAAGNFGVMIADDCRLMFGSPFDPVGPTATGRAGLRQNGSNVLQVLNGAGNADGSLQIANLTASGTVTLGTTTATANTSNAGSGCLWSVTGTLNNQAFGWLWPDASLVLEKTNGFRYPPDDRLGIGWGFSPGTMDTLLRRNGAGGITITTGRDASVGSGTLTAIFLPTTYTVATLPSASANAGRIAQVTDSSVTTNGSAVSGGGSNRVMVFSNGTTWDVVAA